MVSIRPTGKKKYRLWWAFSKPDYSDKPVVEFDKILLVPSLKCVFRPIYDKVRLEKFVNPCSIQKE